MRTYWTCECESPFIRCDHRGCLCQICGGVEPISPRLREAIDATRQKITDAAQPVKSFRVRLRPKQEPRP